MYISKFLFNALSSFLVNLSVLVTLLLSAGLLQFSRLVVEVMQKSMEECWKANLSVCLTKPER